MKEPKVTKTIFSEFTLIEVDMGDMVICDSCNNDYTSSNVSGGILVGSHAYCPQYAPRMRASLLMNKEEHYIVGVCPENMSFGDWIRSIR